MELGTELGIILGIVVIGALLLSLVVFGLGNAKIKVLLGGIGIVAVLASIVALIRRKSPDVEKVMASVAEKEKEADAIVADIEEDHNEIQEHQLHGKEALDTADRLIGEMEKSLVTRREQERKEEAKDEESGAKFVRDLVDDLRGGSKSN